MVGRLMEEDAFRAAAAQVRDEMATQPSPSAVLERVVAALG
jgi:hypothetical protein